MIHANHNYFDVEARTDAEQVLAAVRYVGDRRVHSSNGPVNQGRFPSRSAFTQGTWYVAFIPESVPDGDSGVGVSWFERAGDFESEFDPERIAEILLDKNYIDLQTPAGPNGDGHSIAGFTDRIADELELEDPIEAGASYEDQLADLAGVDDADAQAIEKDDPVDDLVNDYDRAELKEAVKKARDDADEFSLRGVSMEDMAEFLVETADDNPRHEFGMPLGDDS